MTRSPQEPVPQNSCHAGPPSLSHRVRRGDLNAAPVRWPPWAMGHPWASGREDGLPLPLTPPTPAQASERASPGRSHRGPGGCPPGTPGPSRGSGVWSRGGDLCRDRGRTREPQAALGVGCRSSDTAQTCSETGVRLPRQSERHAGMEASCPPGSGAIDEGLADTFRPHPPAEGPAPRRSETVPRPHPPPLPLLGPLGGLQTRGRLCLGCLGWTPARP